MNEAEFEQVADTFKTFHHRFAPCFGHAQTKLRSQQYLHGLLVQRAERRNAENVAEAIDGATPRALQRLLTDAPWDPTRLIGELQVFLGERLSAADGVFIFDESAVPKQGQKSVGVARQYCGALGKVANCQVGVLLAYASSRGAALMDTRLFMPAVWTQDRPRCAAAKAPSTIDYQTKPQLAMAMLREARQRGALVGHWVTGDSLYGMSCGLRDDLDAEGWQYVLEVRGDERFFSQAAETYIPSGSGRGRKPTRPRLVEGAPTPQRVADLIAALAPSAWRTLTVAEGAAGPRRYQFAALRGWECRDGLPGRASWLLARRRLDDTEIKYALSNAPETTALATLARVVSTRWAIESEIQTDKGQLGLDEYEVRSWPGWHHHMALVLLAGAFLLQLQQDWGEKDAVTDPSPGGAGVAGALAPAPLEPWGATRLVGRHPTSQRSRPPRALQTLSC